MNTQTETEQTAHPPRRTLLRARTHLKIHPISPHFLVASFVSACFPSHIRAPADACWEGCAWDDATTCNSRPRGGGGRGGSLSGLELAAEGISSMGRVITSS